MRRTLGAVCVLALAACLVAQTADDPVTLPERVVVPEVIAPDHPPALIAEDVGSWFLLAEKTRLVFRKGADAGDANVYSVSPHEGEPELLFECVDPGGMWRITDTVVAVDQGSAGFYLFDTVSGQPTEVDAGGDAYGVRCPPGPAEWFLMHRTDRPVEEQGPPRVTLYRVDIATSAATKIFEIASDRLDRNLRFVDDGRSIEVIENLQGPSEIRAHVIEIATGDVTVEETTWGRRPSRPARDNVYRINETVQLHRDDDRVLWVHEEGQSPRRLFDTPGADCYVGDPREGGRVALFRIVDTTGDGVAAREDGDWTEVWAVDRQTLETTLLADTSDENITRQWSRDGRFFVFNRVVHAPADRGFRGDLCLYDEPAGEVIRIQAPHDDLYLDFDASLPDGRSLLSPRRARGGGGRNFLSQLWLVDFEAEAPTATVIAGEAAVSYHHLRIDQTLLFKTTEGYSSAGPLYRWAIPPAERSAIVEEVETSD